MQYYKFEIVAVCVLPNNIHLLLNPENITEYSKIISSVKHSFSYDVGQVCPTYLGSLNDLKIGYINKREKGLFQRRFYEHTILNQSVVGWGFYPNNKICYKIRT